MRINIVDAIMGAGKTQAAINYINSTDEDTKFLYVTPYLEEVKRIIDSCPNKHFRQPETYGTKIAGIKVLLNKGSNIATTHALFHLFDDEIIELCYSQGYTLIMDEVTEVVEVYNIGRDDLDTLLNKYVNVDAETGLLIWKEEKNDYKDNKFIEEKRLCEMGCLAMYGNNVMIWTFPVKIFNAFDESYILTYMFQAQMQKYYYDYHKMEYNYLSVKGDSLETYKFTEEEIIHESKYNYKELINILNSPKLNKIGELDYSLSKSWYSKHKNDILIKTLKKNTYNYFHNILDSVSSDNLWTTFKDYKELIKGKGYAKGFLSSSMRATNEYRDRHNIAYLVNKYFNPYLKQFFVTNNITVYEDDYALSEMLQFIWRSAIRQGEPINLYIPSKRMRILLQQWIEKNSIETK